MGFWALIVLGLVQGLTEFLPVSSSGHLVLLSNIFGIEDSLFVSIVLHVATLLSVLVALRKEVWQIVRHPFSPLSKNLVISTIPTCLIVLLIYPFITQSFEGKVLPICFMITAILLLATDFFVKKRSQTIAKPISLKQGLVMGIAQGFATFPGISRSGSTICAGLFAGGDKENVAKFSFLMSVPIIILSMALEIFNLVKSCQVPNVNVAGLIVAFAVAFLVGVFSIKAMIKITQKLRFKWFSLYLILLTLVSLFV